MRMLVWIKQKRWMLTGQMQYSLDSSAIATSKLSSTFNEGGVSKVIPLSMTSEASIKWFNCNPALA